jgi:predicted nucleotide-binding protein (sugar kinase/HSP70/actin superfamily)
MMLTLGTLLAELVRCIERPRARSGREAIAEVFGPMWGAKEIVARAAKQFAALKNRVRDVPTVAVVGEIYVRLDPFANDLVVDKLEARGIRVRFAPFIEWLEYTSYLAEKRVLDGKLRRDDNPVSIGLTGLVQKATLGVLYDICAGELGWGRRTTVAETVESAAPYLNTELTGEAVLTLGGPVHEFRHGLVQGVVIVGPHECMPCKIAEAQYGKVAEQMRLPYLSLALNGDPMDVEALDRFAYDLHEARRRGIGKEYGTVVREMRGVSGAIPPLERPARLVPVEALAARAARERAGADRNEQAS